MFNQREITGFHNASLVKHVDVIRLDVVQNALVVGDDNKRALAVAQGVHPVGDNLQGVDIQTGVGLIQNAQLGLQHRHLQNVVTLFLTAGKTDVHRAGEQIFRHFQQLDFLFH